VALLDWNLGLGWRKEIDSIRGGCWVLIYRKKNPAACACGLWAVAVKCGVLRAGRLWHEEHVIIEEIMLNKGALIFSTNIKKPRAADPNNLSHPIS
jgi:hypothetical protein